MLPALHPSTGCAAGFAPGLYSRGAKIKNRGTDKGNHHAADD